MKLVFSIHIRTCIVFIASAVQNNIIFSMFAGKNHVISLKVHSFLNFTIVNHKSKKYKIQNDRDTKYILFNEYY